MTRRHKLGDLLTKAECDAGLAMLAAAGLPRASVAGNETAVRALYLELLREAGVTGPMLKAACKRYIMAIQLPTKTKFFPDPGQLAALCADDIETRKRELAALKGALALIEAPPPVEEPEADREKVAKGLNELSRALSAGPLRPAPEARPRQAPERGPSLAGMREQLAKNRDQEAVERLRNMTKQA